MDNCLFCKIVEGSIPSEKVYEDEFCYAFKDIDPKAPTHMLFVPKRHIGSMAEVNSTNSQFVAKIFEAIGNFSQKDDCSSGFRVVANAGEDAGQTVQHLHFHLMAGRKFDWPAG
jgi:histidine triad (HIT) family protein